MIIDFHTHVFPDELAPRAMEQLRGLMPEAVAHGDGTAGALLRSMDAAGIDLAVTLPVATRESQVAGINTVAGRRPRHTRLLAFGALFPGMAGMQREVARLLDQGVKGIKLHPEYQQFRVDDPAHFDMYALLSEAELIVVFHAGWDPAPFCRNLATPRALRSVADRFPRLRMVAAHMGGYRMWDEVERWLCGTHVVFDTSAAIDVLSPEEFARRVRLHGAERVAFASDSPWFSQSGALEKVLAAPLSDAQRHAVLCGTAQALLGIA